MKTHFLKALVALGFAATTVVSANAASAAGLTKTEYESQQSSGLSLDYETWKKFNDTYVNGERNEIPEDELTPLNLNELTWQAASDNIEIYFINEGARAINSLFLSVNGGNPDTVVFDPIASANSIIPEDQGDLEPGESLLSLGQGVDLGLFDVGTVLNFFLATTSRNGQNSYLLGPDAATNPDGIAHINVFASGEYLVLGFEDRIIGDGTDLDYNDVVFVVKGLTMPATESVPEPAATTALLGIAAIGFVKTRRRKLA